MGRIIARTRFVLGQAVCHFIGVDQAVARNDRRPTAISIVVHTANHIVIVVVFYSLYSKDDFLGILTCYIEQVSIVWIQLILIQCNDLLCTILSSSIVSIIESLSHTESQSCTLGNATTGCRSYIDIVYQLVEFFFDILLHLLLGITRYHRFLCSCIAFDERHTTIVPVHQEVAVSADPASLSLDILLGSFWHVTLIYVSQQLVDAADA